MKKEVRVGTTRMRSFAEVWDFAVIQIKTKGWPVRLVPLIVFRIYWKRFRCLIGDHILVSEIKSCNEHFTCTRCGFKKIHFDVVEKS